MSFKASLVLFAVLLGTSTLAFGTTDPELKQCQDKCLSQRRYLGEQQTDLCVQRCEEYYREKQQGGRSEDGWNKESPIERLRECDRQCQRQRFSPQKQQECSARCQEEYEKEKQRYEGRDENPVDPQKEYEECRMQCQRQPERQGYSKEQCVRDCRKQEQERQRGHGDNEEMYGKTEGREQMQAGQSPYVFQDQHFFTGFQTEHGRLRILPKFTERSELLRGIENYRVAILEAAPQTFVVPSHWDTDVVLFVANGRGILSQINQERRETFNIKQGDIVRVKAGTTTYIVNRDNNERLILAKLLRPVNTPGYFEAFFGAGGDNPESFYRAFSSEILEAAFASSSDKVQRLFSQQRQGVIIKASEEQIRGMSQHEEGGIWPFGESKGSVNLYEQRPIFSNQYGQLYQVDSSKFKQLRDLDIAITLANITQGAMLAPQYNSKATKISIVVSGEGYFEMACPHLSQEKQGQRRQESTRRQTSAETSYHKVSSRLQRGTVVVIPAGHPYTAVASNNQNLELLCFEINAFENEKFTLAGKRNVFSQLERQAKELAFGMPAREVDEVFRSQNEEFFFKGPRQQKWGRQEK